MKERRYDIFEIMERFSKFEEIEDACLSVQRKELDTELRHDQLLMENQDLEVQISQNSLKFRELVSLKALGFGLTEFRMLRDIITEVGEDRGMIGNEAVRNFFEDLRNYYYEYVQLRKSVSKLRAEIAQASAAADTSNSVINMFQDILKPSSKSSTESDPKYKPIPEVNGSGKKVNPVDNNNVTSANGSNSEPQSDSTTTETLHSCEELHEGDKVVEGESIQENPNSKLEVQLDSVSLSGSKDRKIENELVVPHDDKDRSRIRLHPPSWSKSYRLKKSTGSNSVSNDYTPNTKSHLASEPNELLCRLQDDQTRDLLRNMFNDRAD